MPSPTPIERDRRSAASATRWPWRRCARADGRHHRQLALQELAQIFRRAADGLHKLRRQLLAHVGLGQRRVDLLVHAIDDLGGRAGRCHHRHPGGVLDVGQARLLHRRNVGHQRAALRGRHRKRPELAGLDLRHHGDRRHARELHVALQHGEDRQRRRRVRNVHGVGVGLRLEKLNAELRQAAHAGRGKVELARGSPSWP